jgi:hypothetical protein
MGQAIAGTSSYPNAMAGTDVLLSPLPTGADVSWQSRSPESPERLDLSMNGTDPTVATDNDDTEVEGRNRTGDIVATSAPMTASVRWRLCGPARLALGNNQARELEMRLLPLFGASGRQAAHTMSKVLTMTGARRLAPATL